MVDFRKKKLKLNEKIVRCILFSMETRLVQFLDFKSGVETFLFKIAA
jgi:hypothetical protein